MSEIINIILNIYLNLYIIGLYLVCIFFWISLSYVDRVHLREKTRRYGTQIYMTLNNLSYVNMYYDKLRIILFRPISVILEMITGFIEGIENSDPIICLSSNNDLTYEENDVKRCYISPSDNDLVNIYPSNNTNIADKYDSDNIIVDKHLSDKNVVDTDDLATINRVEPTTVKITTENIQNEESESHSENYTEQSDDSNDDSSDNNSENSNISINNKVIKRKIPIKLARRKQ
jgi:hypothetical protein